MRRREFLKGIVASPIAGPLAARAQHAEGIRRVGVLLNAAADDAEYQARFGAFLQGLQQAGWTIGRNVRIDTHWAGANAADINRHAMELATLSPDVILATGSLAVSALKQATATVPIVFVGIIDPVGVGFRRQLGAAGWQHHRIPSVGIRSKRKMVGLA
jgi:putative ABC transport system substrate-binding protein